MDNSRFENNRERRCGVERRKFTYSKCIPEKRSGRARRSGRDRRLHDRATLLERAFWEAVLQYIESTAKAAMARPLSKPGQKKAAAARPAAQRTGAHGVAIVPERRNSHKEQGHGVAQAQRFLREPADGVRGCATAALDRGNRCTCATLQTRPRK